jgi:hypothetical protein
MARLLGRSGQEVKADGAGFGALGAHPMADGLLGILRDQAFQLGLGLLVFEMRRSGSGEDRGELGPGIGCGHVDDADSFKPRLRRLDPEQLWLFAVLDTPPEFALGGDNQMLIKRIGMGQDLDP